MDRMLYDETHEMFRSTVQRFIDKEIAANADQWEQRGIVDRELYRRAGALGLMGLALPDAYGGIGDADYRFETVLQEQMGASGFLGSCQGILNHNTALAYFRSLCTDEQQQRWFPGLASGDLLATVAMTEPATGSDLKAITTHAVRKGGDFVLNGAKIFISSGMSSDLVLVACRTSASDRTHDSLSLLAVEATMPGFARGRNLAKIGQHAADTAELFFDDVLVPEANLVGDAGRGFYHLIQNLPSERLGIASVAVAHAEAAFQWTLEYCKERRAFGSPIGSFQHNRFSLATMRTELDIGRVYVDRQIAALNDGDLTPEEAAQAKWWCTDLNRRVLDTCLQLHGGYGYMEEYPIARAWRDGRAMSIYGGTNEVMRDLIGRRRLGV